MSISANNKGMASKPKKKITKGKKKPRLGMEKLLPVKFIIKARVILQILKIIELQFSHTYNQKFKFTRKQKAAVYNIMNNRAVGIVCTRGGGKTMICALVSMIWSAFFAHKGSYNVMDIAIVASAEEQTTEFKKHIQRFAKLPIFIRFVKRIYKKKVVYKNGSTTNFYPASERALRSPRNDIIFFDEAARIPTELITSTLPQLVGSPLARIYFLTTPAGLTSWAKQQWDSPYYFKISWTYKECPWMDEDFIELQRASMSKRDFAVEFECKWMPELGAVFPSEAVYKMFSARQRDVKGKNYILGIDVGRIHNSAAVLLKWDKDGIQVVDAFQYVATFKEFINECCNMIQHIDGNITIAYEWAPISYAILKKLRNELIKRNIHAIVRKVMFANQKERIMNSLAVALEWNYFTVADNCRDKYTLRAHMLGYHYEIRPESISKFVKEKDDYVDALAHAANLTPLLQTLTK